MPSRQNCVVIVVIIGVQQQNSVKYYIILCMFILEYTYYSICTHVYVNSISIQIQQK